MKPKRIAAIIFLTAISFNVFAEHLTKVVGLVTLTNTTFVLLEMQDSFVTKTGAKSFDTSQYLAREGEVFTDRELKDAHVQIEIVHIDLTNGLVAAKEDGQKKVYSFAPAKTAIQPGYSVDQISLGNALAVYGSVVGHTMLVHPAVQMSLPVSFQAHDKSELAKAFADFLRVHDIAIIPDGEAFELIVPASMEKPVSSFVQSHTVTEKNDLARVNYLHWGNLPMDQVSKIYSKLIGRKLMVKPLPDARFNLNTSVPLTTTELMHALDVLFAFNGVKAENVGDDSFEIVADGTLKL
jgi:hypothetical protein